MSRNIGTLVNSAMSYNERAMSSRLVSSWSEETASELKKITARLLSEVTALAAKEKTINADAGRSDTGKFDLVKSAVKDFITNLKWLGLEKSTRETRAGNLFAQLFLLPASTRADQATRDGEIRNAMWALPPDQRNNEYLRASETDNVEVLRALQDAPLPLVADEVRLRADDSRAARLQPARYRNFIENGELLSEVSVILADCLDLGAAFGLDVTPSVDELGPKIRQANDFAINHVGGRGKHVLRTSRKDVVGAA